MEAMMNLIVAGFLCLFVLPLGFAAGDEVVFRDSKGMSRVDRRLGRSNERREEGVGDGGYPSYWTGRRNRRVGGLRGFEQWLDYKVEERMNTKRRRMNVEQERKDVSRQTSR